MYTSKYANTNKDGIYTEYFHYLCSAVKDRKGKMCDCKLKIFKTDIEPYIIKLIKDLISNQKILGEINTKISKEVDNHKLKEELKIF